MKTDKNEPMDVNSHDELSEEDLEQVAGGLESSRIRICSVCKQRVAVFQMTICGSCFRDQHKGS